MQDTFKYFSCSGPWFTLITVDPYKVNCSRPSYTLIAVDPNICMLAAVDPYIKINCIILSCMSTAIDPHIH